MNNDPHQTPSTPTTILKYYDDMFNLNSTATLISSFLGDDGRHVLVLDSTVFHPQGGGQPADGGYITDVYCSRFKFLVQDVRSKNGIVYHYGVFERNAEELEEGLQVLLSVDESKRKLNSRLHSAGHLLDLCLEKVGLSHLDPSKGYHFPDG
ncbi:alanine--tRNA ligase, partial [Tanacetum coccineum]